MKKILFFTLAVLAVLTVSCDNGPVYEIGDIGPAGGIIFYVNDSKSDGWRYLEVAPEDITNGSTETFVFGFYRTSSEGDDLFVNGTTYVAGTSSATDGKSTAKDTGTGKANTAKLVSAMGSAAYTNGSGTTAAYAAKLCDGYTYGGFDDWFLPSQNELGLIYLNLNGLGLGDFASAYYWSSSEYGDNSSSAWRFNLSVGGMSNGSSGRGQLCRVRAIRAF